MNTVKKIGIVFAVIIVMVTTLVGIRYQTSEIHKVTGANLVRMKDIEYYLMMEASVNASKVSDFKFYGNTGLRNAFAIYQFKYRTETYYLILDADDQALHAILDTNKNLVYGMLGDDWEID